MATIRNELEYINEQALASPEAFIEKSEQRYRNIITSVAETALSTHGHTLILLAGPSASGKTTTAMKIAEAMAAQGVQAFRISLDDFYYEAEHMPLLPDGTSDIESVFALDLPLLHETLRSLLEDGVGSVPHFQFKTASRSRWDELRLGPDDVIILEGLHALHPEIAESLGNQQVIKVYISVSSRIYDATKKIILHKRGLRLTRRILRDSQFRGTSAAETIAMWPAVTQGEDAYLTPCKPLADVLINSIHLYESCVFRSLVLPLLDEIPPESPSYKDGCRLARSLRQFEVISPELVPADSLMREFLGNG